MHSFLSRLGGVAVLGLAVACVPQPPAQIVPSSTHVQEESERDEAVVTEIAEAPVYSPDGKRDPFRGEDQAQPAVLELGQLRLAFTNTGSSSPMAVLIDGENKSHNVRVGDFLGKHWGRVSAIDRDAVTITTMYAGNDHRVFSHDVTLRMPDDHAPKPRLSGGVE